MAKLTVSTLIGFLTIFPLLAVDASIQGDYLEVRTSDVYVGPCIANGEVNLAGREAILAWRVREGQWDGVSLQGLTVVAVVRANATLGDPFAEPYPAQSVLLVDEKATPEQQAALVDLARSMGGELISDVVWVKASDIDLTIGAESEHSAHAGHGGGFASAVLKAGDVAEVKTRAFRHTDHLCGNETLYYPPLTDATASPAYTEVHYFKGDGLNAQWSSPSKASAFVGVFSR